MNSFKYVGDLRLVSFVLKDYEGYVFLYFLKYTFKRHLTRRKINRSDSHNLSV